MKFTQFASISALCLAVSSHAFSSHRSPSFAKSKLSNTLSTSSNLFSSSTSADTDSDKKVDLPPAYEAVYNKAMEKLEGKLPPAMEGPLKYFVTEYITASSNNPKATPEGAIGAIMQAIQLGMQFGMGEKKFQFGNTHIAIRADDEENPAPGVDFYKFGNDFFLNAIDMPNSMVMGEENLKRAFSHIEKGENVVFLANHQSEADPQVFSLLMESIGLAEEASKVCFVAGHKVTTDTLAIPFSMGRNLLCIHSKKHINSEPELKAQKQKQNLASVSALLGSFRKGGHAVWVAPSGGRDRRDLETGKVPIAPFDQKTVDMFRLMGNKSKVKTHFFPMAMVSYELCPPPDSVEAGTGERRNIRYSPIGIAIGNEVPNVGGVESRHLFTDHAFEECEEDYAKLLIAMEEKKNKMEEDSDESSQKDNFFRASGFS